MTAIDDALDSLARTDPAEELPPGPLRDAVADAGLGFAAVGGPLEARRRQALVELSG